MDEQDEQQEKLPITGPRAVQIKTLQESAKFCKIIAKLSAAAWFVMFCMDSSISDSMGAFMKTAAAVAFAAVLVAIARSHQIEHVTFQAEQEQEQER
jgi:hypothetical protein